MERTVHVELGVDIVDADFHELSYSGSTRELKVVFETGGELPYYTAEAVFIDAYAFRLQQAEYSIDGNDGCDDFAYEVLDSRWLAQHLEQGVADAHDNLRHFKFSLGGSRPMIEVLCSTVVQRRAGPG